MSHNWKKYNYNHILFGKRVQTYRTALGWSLGELCRRTGINKGTLQQVEKKGRSLPENDRIKLVEALSEALEATNKRFDRHKFLALAGLGTTVLPKQAMNLPTTECQTISLLTKYGDICLEVAESHISNLRRELYQGKASFVMEEAKKWYRKLAITDLPETDIQLAAIQLKYGILLGQAQEAVYPWYQRCHIAIQTYNDVEERILPQFPKSFQADYAMLYALRAPLYREIGKFGKSIADFYDGCNYAEKIDDPFLGTTLMRNLAHLWIVQGNEGYWHRDIEQSRKKSSKSQQLSCLVELEYAGGYRRLAYHPLKQLSANERKQYAKRAIDLFEHAQTTCLVEPWAPHTGLIGADGHPFLIAVIKAQCFVWIDPYETSRIIEELKPQATLLFPALLAKMDFTASCAKKMLACRKNDPIPLFNLDAPYFKGPKGK